MAHGYHLPIPYRFVFMPIQEIIHNTTYGLQVRVGQGPGQTKFLAYKKHGGIQATHALAKQVERLLEEHWGKKQKIKVGRHLATNRSGIPGLRFEWRQYGSEFVYLYLVGNYRNKHGRPCAFAYSVEKHGFEGVLLLGLEKRQAHGAPVLSYEEAKTLIWDHYLDVAGMKP